jgi:hypothetical protein
MILGHYYQMTTRSTKRKEQNAAATRLVGWWKQKKFEKLAHDAALQQQQPVLDCITHQAILPYALRLKHAGAAGDVAYFSSPSILEAYVNGTGTFKLADHVFSETYINRIFGDGAYARLHQQNLLEPVNTDDPFTMEVPVGPTYRHIITAANGTMSACVFSAGELIHYFRATGKFKNPFSSSDEFTMSQIAVIGYLANDATLITDVPQLVQLRERLAQEESLLDFLQSEVDNCFDGMMNMAHVVDYDENDESDASFINDTLQDLLDVHVEFVQHMLNLELQSVARCVIAHSAACAKLQLQKANELSPHPVQTLLYKIVETSLDAWKSTEDMTPDTTLRHVKILQINHVHQALLNSI